GYVWTHADYMRDSIWSSGWDSDQGLLLLRRLDRRSHPPRLGKVAKNSCGLIRQLLGHVHKHVCKHHRFGLGEFYPGSAIRDHHPALMVGRCVKVLTFAVFHPSHPLRVWHLIDL